MGNTKLQFLVDQTLPRYDSCKKRADKIKLSQEIVDEVKALGGRFLSQESGVWIEVSDDISRLKVSTLFRNRRKAKKQGNRGQAPAPTVTNTGVRGSIPDSVPSNETQKRARVS